MVKKAKELVGLEKEVKYIEVPQENESDESFRLRQAGLQTVQTSMKGLLGQTDDAPKRKKLLGGAK